MALPIINDKPKYEVNIPSMGKNVKFRPYLVKEEKVLLLAMESKDPQQILQSISDTVIACITDDIDSNKLTTFDIEYLFLKIRSKSVGERAPLAFTCTECKSQNEHTFDLDEIDIKVDRAPGEKIKLTDQISLKMKWPTYNEMVRDATMLSEDNQTEMAFSMIAKCIESIQTEEENFIIKDQPVEEVAAFLESLTSDQYKLLTAYVEAMPQLKHTVELDCGSCGHHNIFKLQGINDFF